MKQVGSAVLVYRVFSKVLSRWQKLWGRQRRKKLAPLAQKEEVTRGIRGHALRKKFGNLGFQHSGAKIRVFEQSRDIIKFWLSYG